MAETKFNRPTFAVKAIPSDVNNASFLGNPVLDNAALAIVRRSAPFGRFPPNMLSNDKDDLWIIITRFKFTREEKMEAQLRGGE